MAVIRPLVLLLLVLVAATLAANHNRHHRHRRELHDWLTAEQKEELKDVAQGTPEFKEKVGGFYNQLPAEKRSEWDAFYKKHCFEWSAKVQTESEEADFQKLISGNNKEKVKERVGVLKEKLDEEAKKNVEMWEEDCYKLLVPTRKRREIESAFQDFVKWMTPEQLGEIAELKKTGTDAEVQAKVIEYFDQLPADRQATLKEEFKGKCKTYFTPLMTPDELEKIETLKGDKDAAGALVKGVVERQDGEVKVIAEKMLSVCGAVYKESRKRRNIEPAFQEFVKWMTPEQLGDIAELKKSGKEAEVHSKVKEFFALLPADQQSTLKEEFKGKCKVYFTPLMTADELEKIKTLKGDKDAAGALVKGVVERQEGDVKAVAEKMMAVCGEVYKESRKRREIEAPYKDFAKWMTPEQLGDIAELKKSGKEAEVQGRVKEFFELLPADQQATLKEEFKGKCRTYFTPLMTEAELEKIQTIKDDKEAAKAFIKTVVDRQEGEVKVIAEKMYGICGAVYRDSRKRRNIEPAFAEFTKWMTPEQLGDIAELKKSGTDADVHSKVKEFFALLPADRQSSLKEEFKGKCKVYFTPLMTDAEMEKIQSVKGDKEAVRALVNAVVERQDAEVKAVAEKMMAVCGEVYKESSRKRREIEAAFQDFVKWMTPEQLGEITALKAAGKDNAEVQAAVKNFFGKLPADQQATLKEEFKGKCRTYFTPLMTEAEVEKIGTLKGDKEAAGALIKEVVDRQIGEVKVVSEKMLGVCGEVYKDSSRRRRDIEPAFQDFVKWMTPEQLGDIAEIKKTGKDSDVQAKVKEFFALLPADQQATLMQEFKGKCKTYFTPLMTSDELEKIETLKTTDKEAAGALVKSVVDRQDGEIKKIAEKMFGICGEVYKESSKSKRDVASSLEKHLSWLQPSEKEEILKMSKEGKSKDDIKKRLLEIVEAKEKDADEKAKTVKLCYAWMDEVATKEEVESLHQLHHVDHGACKKKVREFIGRLPEEKQAAVEASLPFCEKLWYGDHGDHAEHGSDHSHHHHRMRRHLAVIEKYVQWLDASQKATIEQLEASGAEFTVISDKIKEFFKLLPEEKQSDLKEKFQHQCMIWAKEVSKPLEWGEIKKLHESRDFKALKTKLVELEERLTENQKHTIEHVRGVCYRLWGIKDVARRRRVVKDNFDEKAEKYLDWLNEEQLAELKRLKDDGKKVEVMKAILKFYDATSGDQKASAEGKLKEACRDYSLKIFGAEKVGELKKLADEKADKEKIGELADSYVEQIEDAGEKEKAKAVVAGCKHVYASSRTRREMIAREVAEYLQN